VPPEVAVVVVTVLVDDELALVVVSLSPEDTRTSAIAIILRST
jgi:hypothetical protein